MKYKIMEKFEIWCKSTIGTETKMFLCHIIWRKWDEKEIPFKRRAKRIYKKYCEKNKEEQRKFYLIEE